MHIVKPRFSIEPFVSAAGDEVLSHDRPFELAVELINCAKRLVPRTVHRETRYEIGDMVLPVGSKFQARMWLGSYKVICAYHPRYGLENASGRKSRIPVHFRRLKQYQVRVGRNPGDDNSS